jgi:hypothetical protein
MNLLTYMALVAGCCGALTLGSITALVMVIECFSEE